MTDRPTACATGWLPSRASVVALGAALVLGCGCSSCPPDWAGNPPSETGFVYASGTAGEVFVEADGVSLALSRAARRVADALQLDLEERLSVVSADGRLFVEAEDARGPVHALDDLQLVELRRCDDGRTFVLVRLPRP